MNESSEHPHAQVLTFTGMYDRLLQTYMHAHTFF